MAKVSRKKHSPRRGFTDLLYLDGGSWNIFFLVCYVSCAPCWNAHNLTFNLKFIWVRYGWTNGIRITLEVIMGGKYLLPSVSKFNSQEWNYFTEVWFNCLASKERQKKFVRIGILLQCLVIQYVKCRRAFTYSWRWH